MQEWIIALSGVALVVAFLFGVFTKNAITASYNIAKGKEVALHEEKQGHHQERTTTMRWELKRIDTHLTRDGRCFVDIPNGWDLVTITKDNHSAYPYEVWIKAPGPKLDPPDPKPWIY